MAGALIVQNAIPYRDGDAAIEHFSNIRHLMEPIMATASVTGEVLGTPNAKMKEQLGKDGRPPDGLR